jgi:hypothetical protein
MLSKRLRCAAHVALMRHKRKVVRILVSFPDGRTPLWRPKGILGDNIKKKSREA